MATGAFITIEEEIEKVMKDNFDISLFRKAYNRATTIAGIDARSFLVKNCPVSAGYELKDGKIGRKKGGRVQESLQGGADGIWKHDHLSYDHEVGSNVVYAEAIISQDGKHSGGPYEIRPKCKKYLVFAVGPNLKTDVVRTKKVTHPGAKEIASRKTGRSVALLTQAKELVEKNGEGYVDNAIKHYLKAFQ